MYIYIYLFIYISIHIYIYVHTGAAGKRTESWLTKYDGHEHNNQVRFGALALCIQPTLSPPPQS